MRIIFRPLLTILLFCFVGCDNSGNIHIADGEGGINFDNDNTITVSDSDNFPFSGNGNLVFEINHTGDSAARFDLLYFDSFALYTILISSDGDFEETVELDVLEDTYQIDAFTSGSWSVDISGDVQRYSGVNIGGDTPSECPSGGINCSQIMSCENARFYLEECNFTDLDRDNDGIPCESLCSTN